MDRADSLPTDLAECHRLLLAAYKQAMQLERRATESAQRVAELDRVLDATSASYEELQHEHASTLEELGWYKRWVHGRHRERIIEAKSQQHLFDLTPPGAAEVPAPLDSREARQEVAGHSRRRSCQRELDLSSLPHHRHEQDLPDAEKICSCCRRAKDRIGEEVTRILEYVPSKLEVHEHVRPKYACRYCKDGVSSPPPPERPIARGIAGPGLIAQIVVSKFGDHLPLYRQEDIFTRHGLHLSRSTLCDWVSAAADLFRPLYELQRRLMLQSAVLWTDDTPVTVLVGGEEGSRQGRFWTYVGDDEHPYSVYDFTMSRGRDGPQRFLRDFRGYLHADAYAGYDGVFLGSGSEIVEVACWAHARRKFFDARTSSPREAHQVLDWIGQLYDIEDRARPLTVAARRELRAAEAVPVLDRLDVYLVQLASHALPKSALAKAVTYARNQWNALRSYTKDGRLTIDNNTSERTLRHQAIGRKNWLFLGSQAAGPRAAVLYTILAGAKRHRIESWAYVRELLMRLHADDERLEDMLPDHWAAQHLESVLTYRLEESRNKAAITRDRRSRRRAQAKSR
ncbi:MAG TPA: IS66 family transposase [Planctomycetaceae bacterium]|jgi:transposase|nr:IS66 family transposase [Planctomycetaceae bacterium]